MQELEVAGLGDFDFGATVLEWGESVADRFTPRYEVAFSATDLPDQRVIEVEYFV